MALLFFECILTEALGNALKDFPIVQALWQSKKLGLSHELKTHLISQELHIKKEVWPGSESQGSFSMNCKVPDTLRQGEVITESRGIALLSET